MVKFAKDPNAPKRPVTAYFRFVADVRDMVYQTQPHLKGSIAAFGKAVGAMWKNCSDEDRKQYSEAADTEMKAWRINMGIYKQTDSYRRFIEEKKKFFTWRLQKTDEEVSHFEERTAASLKETEAAQKELEAVRSARAAGREAFEGAMAQLDQELIAARAKNTALYARQLNIQAAGRKERHVQSGVTEANAEKLLALAVQKNSAIKQLREYRVDRQKALNTLDDLKLRLSTEQEMTKLFQQELQGLEDQYNDLSKKVREYVMEATKAKEKKADETEASVQSPNTTQRHTLAPK